MQMTENQKLREALQAISHIDDTTNHSVDVSAALDRIGQIARQAIALPTADHLPDAGKMVVDHFPDATKMIETAEPGCELPELPEPFALSVSVHEGDTPAKTYVECQLFQKHPNGKQKLYTADQMRAYARAALIAGRTFEKGVPFCDVIDYIESNTTRWVASSDRYPPEGERVFFMDLATNIVGFDMWAGEGFIWMPSHWMPIPHVPAMRKDNL